MIGRRQGQVYQQRTRKEFTLFCQDLAAIYPQAKDSLVLDNLNTDHPGTFYSQLPADEAFALAERYGEMGAAICGVLPSMGRRSIGGMLLLGNNVVPVAIPLKVKGCIS